MIKFGNKSRAMMTIKADARHMGMAVNYAEIEFKRLMQENPLRQYDVLSEAVEKAAAVIKVDELELKRLMMHRQLELN